MVGTCSPPLPDLCVCCVVLNHREATPVCKATQANTAICIRDLSTYRNTSLVILGLQPPGPLGWGPGHRPCLELSGP